MAPVHPARSEHQHDTASEPHPSVETAADVSTLSGTKSKERGHDWSTAALMEAPSTKWLAPLTYDPDTYDPDAPIPRTPEPVKDDPEAYAAWGRKHFGDDWYEQRKIMLEERNIYCIDTVYRDRQRALRVLEHKIEGRPIRPRNEFLDENWQRLWARLSKTLSPDDFYIPSPTPDRSEQSDVTGYDTYPPTPETVTPPPPDEGPWEALERQRRHDRWMTLEEYQFERIFLKQAIINGERSKREDEEGDRRTREEWEAILALRWTDEAEHYRRKRYFQFRQKGMTEEQIEEQKEADRREADAFEKDFEEKMAWTREEIHAKCRAIGFRPEDGAEVDRMFGLQAVAEPEPEPHTADASTPERVSQPQVSRPRQAKGVSHKTGRGRIRKNTTQKQSAVRRDAQSQRHAPTSTKSLSSGRNRRSRVPDRRDSPSGSTVQAPREPHKRQRRAYEKVRESRRLAGKPPEYGLLPGRGEAPSRPETSRQPPETPKKTTRSGLRNKSSTRLATVKGAKPQGISKKKRAKTARPKKSAKPSAG